MMTIEIIDIVFTVLFDNSFFFRFDDVIAAFVVVTDGAAVVITFAGFVGFNIQVRSDIRLPLNLALLVLRLLSTLVFPLNFYYGDIVDISTTSVF